MFISDKPITKFKDDLLNRSKFARHLSSSIMGYNPSDCITIGLYGSWGCGKTSLIHLIKRDIKKKSKGKDNSPIIIEFNPWRFSDQENLYYQFFKTLSRNINRTDYGELAIKIGKILGDYANLLKPFSSVPIVGIGTGLISAFIKPYAEKIEKWGEEKSKDLDSIKIKLNDLLSTFSRKTIIIIDDIDRLPNNEIRQIFKLITSLGDFPNIIYLIAFDKMVIIKALENVQNGPGYKYLEKVVQVAIDIPMISKEEVEDILFNKLNELLKDSPPERWDRDRWAQIYNEGLKSCFNNIRDIYRYINTLRFYYNIIKSEINPVDYFTIIAIQVFYPTFHSTIIQNRDLLLGYYEYDLGLDQKNEHLIGRFNEMLKEYEQPTKGRLRNIIIYLFPRVKSFLQDYNYPKSNDATYRKDARICSSNLFEIYFKYSVPKGEITNNEIRTIIMLSSKESSFKKALKRLSDDGRINKFLTRFEDYTPDEIPRENIQPIVMALLDIGDTFPIKESGFFGFDTTMTIMRIIRQLLLQFPDTITRYSILKNSIRTKTKSLYLCTRFIGILGQEHGLYNSKENLSEKELTLSLEQINDLVRLLNDIIFTWAKNGRLSENEKLMSILNRWYYFGEKDESRKFVEQLISTDAGLVKFITANLTKSYVSTASEYHQEVRRNISLDSIQRYIPIEDISPRIEHINGSPIFNTLDRKERMAIELFLEQVKRKQKEEMMKKQNEEKDDGLDQTPLPKSMGPRDPQERLSQDLYHLLLKKKGQITSDASDLGRQITPKILQSSEKIIKLAKDIVNDTRIREDCKGELREHLALLQTNVEDNQESELY